jgi:hypothetical protein
MGGESRIERAPLPSDRAKLKENLPARSHL